MRLKPWTFLVGWRGWREANATSGGPYVIAQPSERGFSVRLELLDGPGRIVHHRDKARRIDLEMSPSEAVALYKSLRDRLRTAALIVLAVLALEAPAAAQNGPGWPIGAFDGVSFIVPQYDGSSVATLSGWTFHTGGAAVLELRATVDCELQAPGCRPIAFPGWPAYHLGYARPDVVRAFAGFPVPENTGFSIGVPWSTIPDGWHQLRLYVTDSQHQAPIMAAGAWFIKTANTVVNGW